MDEVENDPFMSILKIWIFRIILEFLFPIFCYHLLPFCQIVTILNHNDGHINARVVICDRFCRHIAYGPRHN